MFKYNYVKCVTKFSDFVDFVVFTLRSFGK